MKPLISAVLFVSLACLLVQAGPSTQSLKPEEAAARYDDAARILKQENDPGRDVSTAFEWMNASAQAGHLPAIAGLGYLYQAGIGVAADQAQAAKWFRMAAEKGHAIAQFNLAHMLVSNQVPLPAGETDRTGPHTEGVEWYRKAADTGLRQARSAYGIILMRGDFSIHANPAKAATYLIPAAEAGDLDAMNALGTMYETGNGVPHNDASAETWFRKAAEAGHVKARANLGALLDPLATNHERRIEAIAWLLLAEQEQDALARKLIADKSAAIGPDDLSAGREKAAGLRRSLRKQK